jgi:carotenoid cleavage dioxygenase-like enzyme
MVIIPRDPARQTQLRTFDVPPVHVFHFGTSKEDHSPGAQQRTADTVQSIEFSAVCLPKGFSMFPTQVRKSETAQPLAIVVRQADLLIIS